MLQAIPHRQKITVLIAVMSGLFLAALDQTIIGTALGRIVEEFNSFESLSWIVTAYLVTSTITVPISGKLSDMYGRRNLLLAGVAVFTLASFLGGIAGNVEALIAARALQGVGGGILFSSAFSIIGDLFTPKERGKWQGVFGAVFGLSSVVGPLLGGFLTDNHVVFGLTTDWRWTFLINVPIGLAVFALIAVTCPNFKHETKHKIDFLGAGLLTIALTALIFACENADNIFGSFLDATGLTGTALRVIFGVIAAIFTVLFLMAERRAASPILPLHLFRLPVFSLTMPIVLLFGAAFMGAIIYLTQYLQQVLGASATDSGLMLMPMIFALAGTSAITGRLMSSGVRYKPLLIGGIVLLLFGMISFATLTADSTFFDVAWRMVLAGIGIGASMPTFNLIVQNEAQQKDIGVATSSVQLSRSLGSTVGTALLGGLLTAGVAASLGDINRDAFVTSLKQNPQAASMLGAGGTVTADTALQLNSPDVQKKIEAGIRSGIEQSALPAAAKPAAIDKALQQQKDFSHKVREAFAASLQKVFVWAAVLVALALALSFFLKEIPLRDRGTTEVAPGH
ncbi:MFS transporter [Candidatus Saccharibacteria bacterium]|nr:MFS transporter [Candidatus Saccharibacteria bacterium]